MEVKYSRCLIYTKKGNLLPYFNTYKVRGSFNQSNLKSVEEYYAKERDIKLMACFRWETSLNGGRDRCFCRIKCPVSPYPNKGEFEVYGPNSVAAFLRKEGWTYQNEFYASMFC